MDYGMSARAVLAELDRRGVRYRAVGADLQIKGPPLPTDLLDELRARKPDIIAALSSQPSEGVAIRVEAFRQQLREWREVGHTNTLPFFVLYDAIEFKNGTCMSCGDPRRPSANTLDLTLRCAPCAKAAEIVLKEDRV
jgi:hypothetical protein